MVVSEERGFPSPDHCPAFGGRRLIAVRSRPSRRTRLQVALRRPMRKVVDGRSVHVESSRKTVEAVDLSFHQMGAALQCRP